MQFLVPKPYSFGYKIKDKHGEQHRQEIGDGLHTVKGSYGFKDERGIERQVNYVADKGGFRAEIKTNEPGTASLNPAAVKMESSAHPYFGTSKGIAAGGKAKESLALATRFGFPGILKYDAAEIASEDLAFDAGIAKENELEKEYLSSELAKEGLNEYGLFKEALVFPSLLAEVTAKEAEAAKFLEQLLKTEATAAAFGIPGGKKAKLEKERLALAKILEDLAKQDIVYSPVFAKENALGLKESELEKEGLAFGKLAEEFPFAPKLEKASLPFFALKPTGFAYGGPLKGGMVKGYDSRFY